MQILLGRPRYTSGEVRDDVTLAASSPPSRRAGPAAPSAALIVGSLLAIAALSWLAVVTQPTALATAAWWPAAGIALGLGIRSPRKYLWMFALAVFVINVPVALWAGRPVPLALAASAGAGLEMVVGARILRGRHDRLPTLAYPRDVGRLLVAAVAAAMVYDLLAAGAALAMGDRADAWTRLITGAPKHAAGILLLTPLFMAHPSRPRQAGLLETTAQIALTLTAAVGVFVIQHGAFLTFVP